MEKLYKYVGTVSSFNYRRVSSGSPASVDLVLYDINNRVDPNCQVPLGFTDKDNDATEYIRAAGCREWK